MTDRIETDRLVLRPPSPEDWPAWHAFYMSPRSNFVGGGEKPVFDVFRGFSSVLGHWQFRGWGMWVLTRRGADAAIGMAGPHYPVGWPEREIGWMIWADGLEGTGLAREAADAARADAYRRLGWATAVSYIDVGNERSRRLAERLGARIDPHAAHPGSYPLLVYRHPSPASLP
jgi:RimJ/RimL family protein N-acetyltransferase